ncbi:jacalin-related lectin 3 [Brachypodium distachyon]|uniref:Jacalin-type lectin domain-containing protein n=1 Tax=Brachypodium distachyon TaxID=15368 RepID=A0A0Q3IQE8_BRADI|nr:jacalin-related lectin 3 [Brachypodium distachyon]XP_024315642.1 jacalin-related lectin 3 [Brachypodium distachyon]XP_024315643.1 jacalin-related lectin 3 [Brachypodium distachyon]XP_024315644.1 jacalin-related lectin 3 [Brachypodium distachyon]XP_024315645.1 jacalin-related lectin 3 [Brachypodium distachyon]XP_024315646.1 jacalin-related lectin 3 [Brachypodium distachyon]XP_024315647.1 jacalin-related lectin 3 [Brachypodium distachyon]KQK02492.1 hypothetical protein BRADI_2g01781v3 [Brac|eukprot:XP_010230396.1 jacalin-related lectin 3 [Brachypodium distachyon]
MCLPRHALCWSCHGELPDKGKCESCFLKTGYGYAYSRCFVPTKYTRCLAVERILRSIRVACPNARNAGGSCSASSMPYHEKAEHEQTCAPGLPTSSSSPSVVKMGPCGGGPDGDAWDMDVRGGVNRIIKVVVRHEDAVNSISALCLRDDGHEEQTKVWGAAFGKRSEICLDKDEYLTGVKGRYGQFDGWSVIRALTFVSNRRTIGPYGTDEGMEFELPAAGGGKIVGFHGRSGGLVDAIGTYVKMC